MPKFYVNAIISPHSPLNEKSPLPTQCCELGWTECNSYKQARRLASKLYWMLCHLEGSRDNREAFSEELTPGTQRVSVSNGIRTIHVEIVREGCMAEDIYWAELLAARKGEKQ